MQNMWDCGIRARVAGRSRQVWLYRSYGRSVPSRMSCQGVLLVSVADLASRQEDSRFVLDSMVLEALTVDGCPR